MGGANTTSGLRFEERVDIKNLLHGIAGYELVKTDNESGYIVNYDGKKVARCFQKYQFYRFLAEDEYNVDWKQHLSKQLLPDNGLFVIVRDTLFIIEVKFQKVAGSVDEKLQTCDFKRKQYVKLVNSLGWQVEYVYVLNDWFKQPSYKDTLDYILSVNCKYVFNEIPLKWFGLPDNSIEW